MVTKMFVASIALNWQQRGQSVVITPEDNDKYVLTVEEVIRACQATGESYGFTRQFDALLVELGNWVKDHHGKIEEAFVTTRDAGLLFLLVRKERRFDEEFADSLTDLDIRIAQDKAFNLIRLSVLALPKTSREGVESFLGPDVRLQYRHAG